MRPLLFALVVLLASQSASAETWTALDYGHNNLEHRNCGVINEAGAFVAVIRRGNVYRVSGGPPAPFTVTYFCTVAELPANGITLVRQTLLK